MPSHMQLLEAVAPHKLAGGVVNRPIVYGRTTRPVAIALVYGHVPDTGAHVLDMGVSGGHCRLAPVGGVAGGRAGGRHAGVGAAARRP